MGYNDKYPDMSAMYSVMFAAEDKLKEEIAALKQELDRTRKALDFAIKHLEGIRGCDKNGKPMTGVISCWIDCDELAKALEQINQKEEK